jgi:hypothetical protein
VIEEKLYATRLPTVLKDALRLWPGESEDMLLLVWSQVVSQVPASTSYCDTLRRFADYLAATNSPFMWSMETLVRDAASSLTSMSDSLEEAT